MDEEETESRRKRRVWQHVGADGSENIYADLFLENCADTSIQCVFVRKECARHDPNEDYLYEELTDEQKYGVDQIKNLDGLLAQAEFHANQLRAAKQYFHLTLSASFKEKKDD